MPVRQEPQAQLLHHTPIQQHTDLFSCLPVYAALQKMDAKAIQERAKALTKAVQANEAPAILKILKELKDGVAASEDLLRSTRIGVTVNRVKTHKDPAVARLAAETVRKWRDEVTKDGKKGGASPNPSGGSNRKPNSGTASPAPMSASAPPASDAVAPELRTWKTDKADIRRTDRPMRNNCIGLMYDGLAFMSALPPATILSVAAAVEAAAHSAHGPEGREGYKTKMRSLYQNLKNKTSAPLRHAVLAGAITPSHFVVMSHDELKSAERRAEDQADQAENMRAAQAPVEEKAVSSSLQCGKCGQKKVSYTQAQTRSADEPMTTFCECMACGRRWKVGAADGDGLPRLARRLTSTTVLVIDECWKRTFRYHTGKSEGSCVRVSENGPSIRKESIFPSMSGGKALGRHGRAKQLFDIVQLLGGAEGIGSLWQNLLDLESCFRDEVAEHSRAFLDLAIIQVTYHETRLRSHDRCLVLSKARPIYLCLLFFALRVPMPELDPRRRKMPPRFSFVLLEAPMVASQVHSNLQSLAFIEPVDLPESSTLTTRRLSVDC